MIYRSGNGIDYSGLYTEKNDCSWTGKGHTISSMTAGILRTAVLQQPSLVRGVDKWRYYYGIGEGIKCLKITNPDTGVKTGPSGRVNWRQMWQGDRPVGRALTMLDWPTGEGLIQMADPLRSV